mgnify:CR=1 FL=1
MDPTAAGTKRLIKLQNLLNEIEEKIVLFGSTKEMGVASSQYRSKSIGHI